MDLKIFENMPGVDAGFTRKPDTAAERRNAMAGEAAGTDRWVIRPRLVHGKRIVCVDAAFLSAASSGMPGKGVSMPSEGLPYIEIESADGLITDQKGVVLTSTHGDCIPVWAWDPGKKVIGLAHAGWKGTLLEISAALVRAMHSVYGCDPAHILAYIGPGIGKCHFEVDLDVADRFLQGQPWMKDFLSGPDSRGKYRIDLKEINRKSLEDAGVSRIGISDDCTFCREDLYYSYRRCGDKERMLAYIELK